MAIVLTTGFPRSKPEFVHSVLSHAGLEDASPCVKTELSPTAITSRTLADLKVDAADWENVRQINPSKLCQALTVDLAIANLNKQNWGWADPNNIRLLNFWYNFDPQTRFCLVYTSPEMVAANLSATEPITARSLHDMLEQWRIYNEELLAFYNRHNARCVLVNFDVLAQPRKLLDICDQKLGVQLSGGEQKCENASTDHAIERLAIRTLLGGSHRFEPLYQDLESCADLPAFANIALDELAAIASDQHRLLKKEIADNSELIGLMSAERDNQKKANELLSVQLRRVHEQLERVCLRLQITEKRIRSLVDPDGGSVSWSEAPFWLQKLKMQIEGDAKEKEILANQLRKSREEQESYKRLCLNQKATTEQSSERNVTYPIVVDLRQPIIGDNWYDVEADGRWAGSEKVSALELPTLDPGYYRLEIEVLHAMSREILRGMRSSVNGKESRLVFKNSEIVRSGHANALKNAQAIFKKRRLTWPVMVSLKFEIDKSTAGRPAALVLHFPNTLSPALFGSADKRELAIHVRQIKIFSE